MTLGVPASKQTLKVSFPSSSRNSPRSYPAQNPIGAWRRTNISLARLTAISHGRLSSLPNSCSQSRKRTRDSMHNYRNGWHASKDGSSFVHQKDGASLLIEPRERFVTSSQTA